MMMIIVSLSLFVILLYLYGKIFCLTPSSSISIWYAWQDIRSMGQQQQQQNRFEKKKIYLSLFILSAFKGFTKQQCER